MTSTLSEKDFIRKKNKWLPKIKEYVDKNDPGATIIPISGAFEQKLMEMDMEHLNMHHQLDIMHFVLKILKIMDKEN